MLKPMSHADNQTVVTTLPDGTREWRVNGQLHREDGPAIEYADGTREWWRNGKFIKSENANQRPGRDGG